MVYFSQHLQHHLQPSFLRQLFDFVNILSSIKYYMSLFNRFDLKTQAELAMLQSINFPYNPAFLSQAIKLRAD
jgi:hypothetical protein